MLKYDWFNSKFSLPEPLKKVIPFLLFSVAIGINIYLRLSPAYFPQLKQQAQFEVEKKAIEDIAKKVDDAYPDFNSLAKKKITLEIFSKDKKNKDGFKKEIQDKYKELKNLYQDEHGRTYLLEVDGYQWMRYLENILKNGHPGDRIKDGYPYDDYMVAPVGRRVITSQYFFYLSAFLFSFVGFFLKNLSLVSFLFYLPLFYVVIFLVFLYFFVRSFFSDVAAFFSVILVGLNSIILAHTICGWFDYDSLTLLLPLIIVWLLSLALKDNYHIKKWIVYSLFAGFSVAVYAGIWVGYWWIFSICGISFLYIILNAYSLNKKAHQEALAYLLLMAIFFVSSLSLSSLVLKTNTLQSIFSTLQNILHLGVSQGVSIWPFTYYTVGELFKPTPQQLMQDLGGPIITIFALLGTLFIYIKEKRTERKYVVIFMVFWTFAMVFAASRSLRFIAFLAVPLGIFFGIFTEYIFKYIYKKFRKKSGVFFLIAGIFFTFIFWSVGGYFNAARMESKNIYPLMNDGWNKALIYIKKNTPKKSIINSWWDFGNFFKTVSDRRVIFDPQSQDTTLSYWMSFVLLTEDENKAINVLRMLNNSSNTLFDDMQKEVKNDFQCVELLKRILGSNEKEAIKIMGEYNISEGLKKEIIETIFSKEPPPAYFVVDKSMIYKMYNISFLGNWDFSKLYVIRNKNLPKAQIVENLTKIFSLPKNRAEKIYEEVIISTSEEESNEVLSKRYSLPFVTEKSHEEGKRIYFDDGIILDLSDFSARILTLQKGFKKYKYVFIYDGSKFSAYENKDTDYNESILFVKNKDKWIAVGLSKELAGSLFTRLYFSNGAQLKFFTPFYADKDAGLYVYKINWQNKITKTE